MDNFDFDKVKKRTNVDKDTIIDLAKMVNENGLKDEKTLRTVMISPESREFSMHNSSTVLSPTPKRMPKRLSTGINSLCSFNTSAITVCEFNNVT